jgi:hypothetical protein
MICESFKCLERKWRNDSKDSYDNTVLDIRCYREVDLPEAEPKKKLLSDGGIKLRSQQNVNVMFIAKMDCD